MAEKNMNSIIDERFDDAISPKYRNDINNEIIKEKIIKYLRNNKAEVNIINKQYGFIDKIKLLQNQEELDNLKGIVIDDKIETLKCDRVLIDLIKDNLSTEVTSLNIPKEVFQELDLSLFPNLKTLKINGSTVNLNKVVLHKMCSNQNIENIEGPFDIDDTIKEESIMVKGFSPILYYQGKIIKSRGHYVGRYINIYSKNPVQNIDEITEFIEKIKSDNIDDIKIDDKQEMSLTKPFIDYSFNKKGSYSILESKKNEEDFYSLTINKPESIQDIIKIIQSFKEHNLETEKVILKLENKTYENIYDLKKYIDKYNIIISYDDILEPVSLSDYIAMRETLDYYKSLIEEANLSNFEKLIYAYDLIKSFEYQEVEEGNDLSTSRQIHSIVREGKIVCVGYATFLSELLKELDIESYAISTMAPLKDNTVAGHERNLVRLKDDKYKIDGVYALDSTWDSAHNLIECIDEEGKTVLRSGKEKVEKTDTIIKFHDNLSLYRHFMIPGCDYQKVFKGERMPKLDSATKYDRSGVESFSNDKKEISEDNKDFNRSQGISQEKLLLAIKNVRYKEGYTKETIGESLESVVSVNRLKPEQLENIVIKR